MGVRYKYEQLMVITELNHDSGWQIVPMVDGPLLEVLYPYVLVSATKDFTRYTIYATHYVNKPWNEHSGNPHFI